MKVLYKGESLEMFLSTKNVLKENKIEYKDRIKRNDNWINFLTQLFVTGTGSYGMNNEHKQYYFVSVNEKDFDRAQQLIRELKSKL